MAVNYGHFLYRWRKTWSDKNCFFLPTVVKNNAEHGGNENILRKTGRKKSTVTDNHKAIIQCFYKSGVKRA